MTKDLSAPLRFAQDEGEELGMIPELFYLFYLFYFVFRLSLKDMVFHGFCLFDHKLPFVL